MSIATVSYFDFGNADKAQIDAWTKAYNKLITGKEDGAHDILISTKSQLCRTNSYENLAISENVYPPNVDIHITKDIHCYGIPVILDQPELQDTIPSVMLFDSKETINHIIKFWNEHNPKKTSKP